MSQFENKGGLLVPATKKTPRKIKQLVSCGSALAALADDGTAWYMPGDANDWQALPELPNG